MGKKPKETEYVCLMPGTLEHALLQALIATRNELDRLKLTWRGRTNKPAKTPR